MQVFSSTKPNLQVAIFVLFLIAPRMMAATSWTGGAAFPDWSNASNWSNGVPSATEDASFLTTYGNGTTIHVDGTQQPRRLDLNHGAFALTFTNGTIAPQATGTSGIGSFLRQTGASGNVSIRSAVAIADYYVNGAAMFNISGSGSIEFAGPISLGTQTNTHNMIQMANTATLILSGPITGVSSGADVRIVANLAAGNRLILSGDNSNWTVTGGASFRHTGQGTVIIAHPNALGPATRAFVSGGGDAGSVGATRTNLLGGAFTFTRNTTELRNDADIILGTDIASGKAVWNCPIDMNMAPTNASYIHPVIFAALQSGGAIEFNQVIRDRSATGTNARPVQVSGAGTVIFSAANTYTAGTTIYSGTLLVNNATGSGTGTGAVLVHSAATLGGTGLVSGAVTVNGALSPGNSSGTLTLQNSVTFNPGSVFRIELSAADNYDQLIANGVTINGGALELLLGFAPSSNDTFTILNNTALGAMAGTFTNLAEGGIIVASYNAVDYQFQASYNGGTGNDLVLTVIPEPESFLLTVLGLLPLIARRRAKPSIHGGQ